MPFAVTPRLMCLPSQSAYRCLCTQCWYTWLLLCSWAHCRLRLSLRFIRSSSVLSFRLSCVLALLATRTLASCRRLSAFVARRLVVLASPSLVVVFGIGIVPTCAHGFTVMSCTLYTVTLARFLTSCAAARCCGAAKSCYAHLSPASP